MLRGASSFARCCLYVLHYASSNRADGSMSDTKVSFDLDEAPLVPGEFVRAYRQAAGLTQRQLAADLDINNAFLHRIENGAASFSSRTARKAASVMALATGHPYAVLLTRLLPEDDSLLDTPTT